MNARLSCLASAALACLTLALPTQAAPTFVNGLTIPGSTGDQFGTSVNDGRLGMFSDIYYDRNRHEWWGLSDRGPGGGTLNYDTRVQRFSLDVDFNTGAISNFQVQQTIKFSNASGTYNGIAPSPTNLLGNAFDPEGLVINPRNGHLLVSDEYGPSLYEFDRSGALVKTYTPPANLVPRNAGDVPNYASDAGNTLGKRTNRGFEGLAISPDGQFVYAQLQSAALDEGGGNGSSSRIVKFDTASGAAVAQYAYYLQAATQGRGTSALVALGDERFLVLERNNRGVGAGSDLASPIKSVYQIDLTGATDVSGVVLPNAESNLPSGTVAVTKGATPFLDLAADTLPELGLSPEKWEGLAVGPQLADGSYLLLAGNDNDYSVTQNGSNVQFDVYFNPTTQARLQCDLGSATNCYTLASNGTTVGSTNLGDLPAGYALIPGVLHAYKVSAADLGGYTTPVPEPESYALMLAGLGLVGWMAKRQARPSSLRG